MTTQPTKIIIVTYESGVMKWFSFTIENMESILSQHLWIDDIRIVFVGNEIFKPGLNKIILVEYDSSESMCLPFTLRNIEVIINEGSLKFTSNIQIIEQGE